MSRMSFGRVARHVALAALAVALLVAPFGVAPVASAQGSFEEIYQSAMNRMQSGDYQGAVDEFTRAAQMAPDVAQAYAGRAAAKVYTGDLQGALQDLSQALQIDPAMAEAYYNRGLLRAQSGDVAGAVGDLSQAATIFGSRGDQRTSEMAQDAIQFLQQ